MVYSTIKWCHDNHQKFLFLLAPNKSGSTFLSEAQQLVRDTEDHEANPDLWAVAFYGPQTFRDKLPVLPESDADGRPAATFSGVPYWLIHHLRDPKHWARLTTTDRPLACSAEKPCDVTVDLTNSSEWLDLTPVLQVRSVSTRGYQFSATLEGTDVTASLLGDGLVFNRQLRLNPEQSRRLTLHITHEDVSSIAPGEWQLTLFPHPTELNKPNQMLTIEINNPSHGRDM